MRCRLKILFLTLVSVFSVANASELTEWLNQRVQTSRIFLDKNISTPGYKKGFVIAAPWIVPGIQDYRFHWVRDAGIVMNTVASAYATTQNSPLKARYFAQMRDYLNFSKENQTAPEEAGTEVIGLGEVKFNPDGSRFTKWMRPQNDGPALRAITAMKFVRELLKEGKIDLAKHLFDGSKAGSLGINASELIKADLDYLVLHWDDMSFDPWEEVKGHHFYTSMVQRKALQDGIALAQILGDKASAKSYIQASTILEKEIERHWLQEGAMTPVGTVSIGMIWDTFDKVYGPDYKVSGLDVSVILASLHGHNEYDTDNQRFYSASNSRVLKTAFELSRAFDGIFAIAKVKKNKNGVVLGTPIGRYPFDKYNGYTSELDGNPWFLATAAFSELYYRCALEWEADQKITVDKANEEFISTLLKDPYHLGETIFANDKRFATLLIAVRELGDSYLQRVRHHEGSNGHLTEQYTRENGALQGAVDLTWSYASILSAAEFRVAN